MLCGIGQIIFSGDITGRVYLGLFLIMVEQGTAVSGYSWCQICTNPKKMIIECLYLLFCVIFSNKSGRNHLAYETYACGFDL